MKNLKVEVKEIINRCGAKHKPGDYFLVTGQGKIQIPDDKEFCMYAISSLMPFLTGKQREDVLSEDDWIPITTELCCPDPEGVVFEIKSL